jgi:hypothetical protein
MRAKSPAGLGMGALGLGRVSMSCGERISGDAFRENSADIVGSGGLATETGAKGCWTEMPRRCRACDNHISIKAISMGQGSRPKLTAQSRWK